MLIKNGPIYTEVVDLLCEAHKACLKANQGPGGDALGMSHGAFSGLSKVLGLVWELETKFAEAEMQNILLRQKIKELKEGAKPAPIDF